jgi:hypothetical protein
MAATDGIPTTDTSIFRMTYIWLHERLPPVASHPRDLLPLMKTWVTLSTLGMWAQQNTKLRITMAFMQPWEFERGIEVVKWVYANTAAESKLRGFVVALFCQRMPRVTADVFGEENEKVG